MSLSFRSLTFVFLLFCLLYTSEGQTTRLDSLESLLVLEMGQKEVYDEKKMLKIEAYKTIGSDGKMDPEQRLKYHLLIIEEFEKYSFDSTLFYLEKALRMADDIENHRTVIRFKLKLAGALGNAGRSKEAEDILKEIPKSALDSSLQVAYFSTARKLFEDLRYYSISEINKNLYQMLYSQYKDSLISRVSDQSEIYLALKEKELLDRRQLDDALAINSKRLTQIRTGTKEYSLTTFQRSLIYGLTNDVASQKEYLILSAISDIQASVKDNASLTALASILFHEGEIEKAYRYIQYAYQDAVDFNSRLRFLEISKILSMITAAYQDRLDMQNKTLRKNLIIISVLSAVLAISLLLIFRQVQNLKQVRKELKNSNHKLNDLNAELSKSNNQLETLNLSLSEANHVKEEYIANFLNIQSEYIEKIDNYQKLVRKMLVARKFDDLLNRVNSQQYIEKEVAQFYDTFDKAFLNIYPNFIDQLNKLIEPDGKVVLKEGEKLNTELRIFALIRLGIKDSSHIARLLRYSVNTIYNYRVKIKNKSVVPREEFENHVESIDAVASEKQ